MQKICNSCHYVGWPDMPGSGWIELILYCFYFVPGVLYSIWRRREKVRNVCPSCGMRTMIPYREEPRKIESEDLKKCPACAETIKAEAILCRYCKTELQPMEQKDWMDSFT